MLELFASVGVQHWDLTHIDIDGNKRGFRRKQTLRQLRTSIPYLVGSSERRQNSLIVRPHNPMGTTLVQLDDLDAPALERVRPAAFLTIGTSPGNFQAWVAVTEASGRELARRLRKGVGADPTASGATRVAGTANYKRKYEPDFPVVGIGAEQPGKTVSPNELELLGLLAPPDIVKPVPLRVSRRRSKSWPSYQFCLEHAPHARNSDRPDISRADFTWCMTAIDWGWSVDDTAARLLEESAKARENGAKYAEITAANASAAVERRKRAR